MFFFLIFPSRVVLVSNEDRTKQHGEKGREPKRGSTNQNGTSINGADRNSPGPSGNFFWGNKGSADQIEDKSPSQNKWLGLDIRYQNSLFHSLQALIWFRLVFLSIFGSWTMIQWLIVIHLPFGITNTITTVVNH